MLTQITNLRAISQLIKLTEITIQRLEEFRNHDALGHAVYERRWKRKICAECLREGIVVKIIPLFPIPIFFEIDFSLTNVAVRPKKTNKVTK